MASPTISRPTQRVVHRAWHLFDATDQPVGRLAQRIATLLTGKHKPSYAPQLDDGDTVVVLNAEKIKFTGNKWDQKVYRYHTGFPGGLKSVPAKMMLEKHPTWILSKAVSGMVAKNKFKVDRMQRLKVCVGVEHPYEAQLRINGVQVLEERRQAEMKRELQSLSGNAKHQVLTDEMYAQLLPTDPDILKHYHAETKRLGTSEFSADARPE